MPHIVRIHAGMTTHYAIDFPLQSLCLFNLPAIDRQQLGLRDGEELGQRLHRSGQNGIATGKRVVGVTAHAGPLQQLADGNAALGTHALYFLHLNSHGILVPSGGTHVKGRRRGNGAGLSLDGCKTNILD